jgi:hypothetical protein
MLVCTAIGLDIGLAHASDFLPGDVNSNKITQEIHNIDDDWGTNLTSYANTCKANTKAVNDFRESCGIPKNALLRIPSSLEIAKAILTNKWHRKWIHSVNLFHATLLSETPEGLNEYNSPRDIFEGLRLWDVSIEPDYLYIRYTTEDNLHVTAHIPYLQKAPKSKIIPWPMKVLGYDGPILILSYGEGSFVSVSDSPMPEGLRIICKQYPCSI